MNNPGQVKDYRFPYLQKNEAGRVEDIWTGRPRFLKTFATFWHFWSIRIQLHGTKSTVFLSNTIPHVEVFLDCEIELTNQVFIIRV